MAARESSCGDIKKEELEDMTTCCICTEVYTDPKALPCIHTFCMKCIQQTGLQTNKGPGDEMPCPICRRQFKIPQEGFHGLPKNFFIQRLIQVAQVSGSSSASRALCSVCMEESKEEAGKEIPMADTYCVDCKYKLCKECCSEHKRFKVTKNHKLIPLNEHEGDQNVMTNIAPSVCERHEQNVLNVYCADCKTVVCANCFIDDHKNHEGSHVNKFFEGFRKQIERNTETINECISLAQLKQTELLKVKEEMQQRVKNLECVVANRKDEIKQLTDKHANSLLEGLSSKRQRKLKEIQMATSDIDEYLSYLESYNSYCQKIMAKGSANDICRAVSDLSVRADELQQQCQPISERGIRSFNFCFRKSELEEFLEEDCGNLIGEIEEEGDFKPKKSSKEILLAKYTNEIDLLRKEIEIERTNKESLRLAVDQFRMNVNKEMEANKTLTKELKKEKANYKAHITKLKQELENKITSSTLQARNDKLKQEYEAEKMANNSLQANNDKLLQEVDRLKITVKTSEINAEKLKEKLVTIAAATTHKILVLEQKQEQQRKTWIDEKKGFVKQIQEQHGLTVRVKRQSEYKWDPVLLQTIRTKAAKEEKKEIRGLTVFDKELFVVSYESSEVEVYDLMKFSLSRRWNLKEFIDPFDIGSCNKNNCLYIFGYKGADKSNEIFRVDPNGKLIKKWSTEDDYGRLSVTDESNVILTVISKNKLNEYSSEGQLIRKLSLPSDAGIRSPCHAVKLTNGHFVVSHGLHPLNMHRVCVMDGNGKLKRSFGGRCGSTIGQMNNPTYLAIDGNGFVMVADSKNSRVLLMDSDLRYKKEILSKEKHGLRDPWSILLDEDNGRLFVADNEKDNQRILIFDLI